MREELIIKHKGVVAKALICVVVLYASLNMNVFSNLLVQIFHVQIEAIVPSLNIDRFSVGTIRERGEHLYLLDISAKHPLKVGSNMIPIGASFSASTLIGHSAQNFLLLFLLITWVGRPAIKSLLLRLLAAIPAWIAIEMLDTPLVLLGSVFNLLFFNLAPDETNFLVTWSKIQESGGRFAFALFAGLVVIAMESRFSVKTP